MKNYPNITQSFAISGMVVLGLIVFSPVCIMLSKLISYEAAFLIYYLVAVGITAWIIGIIRKKKTGSNTFKFSIENKWVIPIVIIGTIFLYSGIVSPITALIPMSESEKEAFLNYGAQTGLFSLIQSIIAAPILEELIFRGIILDGLLKRYSPLKSILISSSLFGLVHLDPSQFVVGLIMGIFTGWIYYKTRSLTLAILIHSVYNLSSVLMRYFLISDSMKESIFSGMYGGMTNMIYVVTGSAIATVICVYFFLRREFKQWLVVIPVRTGVVNGRVFR